MFYSCECKGKLGSTAVVSPWRVSVSVVLVAFTSILEERNNNEGWQNKEKE